MLFVLIERYRSGQAGQVYDRLRRRGRMLPDNVRYVDSWVDTNFSRCFQVIEAPDQASLDAWVAAWADLVEFECIPVYTGAEAFAIAADWESRKHLAAASRFKPRQWTRSHGETLAAHIIQTEENRFQAAITMRGEPTQLVGGAPTRDAAELIAKRQLDALNHRSCADLCDRDWSEDATDGEGAPATAPSLKGQLR